ncbi:MAG: exodeoxyribonuclease VII small subunit [Lachnospiraceae bacterium]|nr:exodeoxyribonuclease VII small subunit [Lachnospiraceae bacterium]
MNKTEAAASADQKKTVEENFALLDEIVRSLEDPSVSLEECFRLYQEGMNILKDVHGTIDTYEKKIQILRENGETEDFR